MGCIWSLCLLFLVLFFFSTGPLSSSNTSLERASPVECLISCLWTTATLFSWMRMGWFNGRTTQFTSFCSSDQRSYAEKKLTFEVVLVYVSMQCWLRGRTERSTKAFTMHPIILPSYHAPERCSDTLNERSNTNNYSGISIAPEKSCLKYRGRYGIKRPYAA